MIWFEKMEIKEDEKNVKEELELMNYMMRKEVEEKEQKYVLYENGKKEQKKLIEKEIIEEKEIYK